MRVLVGFGRYRLPVTVEQITQNSDEDAVWYRSSKPGFFMIEDELNGCSLRVNGTRFRMASELGPLKLLVVKAKCSTLADPIESGWAT